MAATKTKAPPVGSAQWIESEREQAALFVDQEAEEFSYSVRNEMEWLNEHMGDVFSRNQVSLTDIFKTPGKLRGKTPRTARKYNVLGQQRQPLTDIFAPNTQKEPTPAKNTAFYDKITQIQIAEDGEDEPVTKRPVSRANSPQRIGKPGNTDSGYHGMTEDEMEVDNRTVTNTQDSQENERQMVPLREEQPPAQRLNGSLATTGRTSGDESFVSAEEAAAGRNASKEQLQLPAEEASDDATIPDENMEVDEQEILEHEAEEQEADEQEVEDEEMDEPEVEDEEDDEPNVQVVQFEDEPVETVDEDMAEETSHSPSTSSTPHQTVQRKSSFTFSSLPAREPLAAKRSLGMRNSQIDTHNRNSTVAKSLGKSFGLGQNDEAESSQGDATKLHSKTSTQLLHERISMLGKAKEARTSKSLAQNPLYPQLPANDDEEEQESEDVPQPPPKDATTVEDDDDDWIAPVRVSQPKQVEKPQPQAQAEARPALHHKSISTTFIPSPTRAAIAAESGHHKAISHPNLVAEMQSTTPAGSPKKHHDGPLSASKNRLWSALKSAKNIFASSASASAAAKLEAHNSPAIFRSPKRDFSAELKNAAVPNMPGGLYSETQSQQSPSRQMSVISEAPSRKTRSSTESDKKKEKTARAQQKAENELEKAREKERKKAAKEQEERLKAEKAEAAKREKEQQKAAAAAQAERPASAESTHSREEMPPPPPPKSSLLPAGKLRAPAGKPIRPTRQAAMAKPAPVNIRIASQSQRMGPTQPSMSSSQYDMGPPPPPKSGLRTISAQGNTRNSAMPSNNTRVKALEAAARKKEQEEKEKQRKAEAKRELERKRAEKAEEDRRVEAERKAEEQRRAQEAKLAAQRQAEKQAAEAKRREQQRLEMQRQQEAAQKAKAAHDLAEAIQRERAQQQPHPRGDVSGTLRQLAQNTGRPPVQPNPAKPAKRVLQDGEDDSQAQRPGMQRGPASYQQNEAKRRRTNEGEEESEQRHSVMAPPKRPSTMRKETLTKFPHGYAHAPPPANHHVASMFKSTVTAQHQMQHGQRPPTHPSQTVQVSNARIPFAENANPQAGHQYAQSSQLHPGYENAVPGSAAQSKFKTPGRPAQKPKSAKSSPMYPMGDNIALPDIATDSEEEDSEDEDNTGGFRAPSWVASPALRELLTQQQLVDPESVFGPIPDLKMDEVFKGAKAERMKRFRDRGSSAAWVQNGDAVTSEEKRKDMEIRERVAREGGWRYDPAEM